jgi:hypothetical protein
MATKSGRVIPLSLPRRMVCDLIHFGKQVPAVTVQRKMNIADLVKVRKAMESRPSWVVLFAKAFALTARTHAALRRAFVSRPWPHLYEHPFCTASFAVERIYGGEPSVFFAKVRSPETHSLAAMDKHLQRFKEAPLESVSCFRRALFVGRLPRLVRHFLWYTTLNWCGAKRVKRLGTFGVSVYAGLGAASLNPISPLTCTLNFDVIREDGSVDVRIIYDHRVMDGSTVARALGDMEKVLNEDILDELTSQQSEQTKDPKAKDAAAPNRNQLLV